MKEFTYTEQAANLNIVVKALQDAALTLDEAVYLEQHADAPQPEELEALRDEAEALLARTKLQLEAVSAMADHE